MKELNLTQQNFTASMILQQVLNEQDLKIRQSRQYSFFNISKNIVSNLSKMGSPLFFKPFGLELRALNDAFNEFKTIYADKNHPEHHKILINTDISLGDGKYITNEEIRTVIAEVLFFLKENHIKDIISFDYTNKHKEIKVDDDTKQEVLQKFSQELKKNNVEKDLNNLADYLSKNHRELFELIKDMLAKISDDRSLIYQEITQEKLADIENQLILVKEQIAANIETKFGGNSFLFWSNQVANQIFESYGVIQPEFISYMSNEVYGSMKIVLPQIERDLSNFNKVQIAIDMFKDKTDAQTFSIYLRDYNQKYRMSDSFKEQIKNSPKVENEVLTIRKDLFNQYLNQTLRQYYQNIIKD